MLQTKDGKTPSEIAKRNKHLEVSYLLIFLWHVTLLFQKFCIILLELTTVIIVYLATIKCLNI